MGTHYRGTKEEVRALNAFIALVRASQSLAARLSAHLNARRLTESQFGALEALHHLGPLCQADLGRKLLCTGGNVTFVIDNLEKSGLVRRERKPEDRRFITVLLTDKGRRLIGDVFPGHLERIVAEMSVLAAREQEELYVLCRKLGRRECGEV